MKFPFTKMHGLGNDFVVFDFSRQSFQITAELARKICDRHFGIGCDQILIVESSGRAEIDFKYRIINADGSEVGQCGNGARCVAIFVHEQGLTDKPSIAIETLSGRMQLQVDPAGKQVSVEMGVPAFEPNQIPIAVDTQQQVYQVEVADQNVQLTALSIGNPHAVISVKSLDDNMVQQLGSALESHAIFPEGANVGFMRIIDRHTIQLRVYERGVGETLACGSGACAAAVAGIRSGDLDSPVTVELPGGALAISWAGSGSAVMMTGPTETVFTGHLII